MGDTMTAEDAINLYRQVKAAVAEIEARHKKELEEYKSNMMKLEGFIDDFLAKHELVNIKTKYGTAYWKTRWSASLVDPDAFMKFVSENGRWDLMDRKANVAAVRDYAKTESALPPGAKLDSVRKVHVIKAGASIPDEE
jgi:hypothetical protein